MTRKSKKRTSVQLATQKRRSSRLGRAAILSDPLDAVIGAMARSLELNIDKPWKPAIRAHLQVTLQHGAAVAAFALPDETEPAPVFEP
jgi:Protein of unknown function (DUF4089)